ncbi:MAG TPA: hypothetical protein VGO40_15725 [Longimicrobium sp.]|nr:hypothetical protein [Longimicrobium sp.]
MEDSEKFPERILNFQFDGTRITMPQLLEAASRVLSILREVDARATEREGGSLDWVIRDMHAGSAAFEVQAEPMGAATPIWAPEVVVRHFKDGIRRVVETGERPEYFTEYAMRRAYELTSLLDQNGIAGFRVGLNGDSVRLTPEMRKPVREALEGRYQAIGSLEGRIDGMSAHEPPYFCTVYSMLSGEPVRCSFGPELLAKVWENFRQRVTVRGVFTTRPDGEITGMRINDVERFPDVDDLPSVDDILGILVHGD